MSNWERLQAKLVEKEKAKAPVAPTASTTTVTDAGTPRGAAAAAAASKKRKRRDISEAAQREEQARQEHKAKAERLKGVAPGTGDDVSVAEKALYVGMDCEMVGVGDGGKRSVLARVTLVDFDGRVMYDEHVRPKERITDFRTWVSGVKAKHLKEAISLKECIQQVSEMVRGKVIVGHALQNDLQVLMLQHPVAMIRDTARYRAYMRPHGRDGGKLRPRRLKDLAQEMLGMEIQEGKHDSGEDARAAMLLYRAQRVEWEKELRKKHVHKHRVQSTRGSKRRKAVVGGMVQKIPVA